jgi:serine protease Do
LPERGATANTGDDEAISADDKDAENKNEPKEEGASGSAGVVVRSVWPDSPAAKAGLQAGDRIVELGDEQVGNLEAAIAQLNAKSPGDELTVHLVRAGEKQKLSATLSRLPDGPLDANEQPASRVAAQDDADATSSLDLEELKLPEMSQTSRYLEPRTAGAAPGLLLWLGDGKASSAEAMRDEWRETCQRDGLILLIAEPGDPKGWSGDDLEYLVRLLQTATQRFSVDSRRVVVAGAGRGGQLAYALAFGRRQVVRGVATFDSPLPRTLHLPENQPGQRLAIFSVESENSALSPVIRADLRKATDEGYPAIRLTRRAPVDAEEPLEAAWREKLARWIDGLDRF